MAPRCSSSICPASTEGHEGGRRRSGGTDSVPEEARDMTATRHGWPPTFSELASGVRSVVDTYLSREEGAHYQPRLAVTAALGVGIPAIAGVALGDEKAGIFTALASWLMMRATPKGDTRQRVTSLLRRCLLMTAGIGLGALTGGWAALPLVALAALCAPLRAIGVFPALCVVIGASSADGGVTRQVVLFLAGGLFGCL